MKPEATDIADLDLERGLIASLLADNSAFEKLGQLQPDDLFDPTHASILSAGLDLRADRRPVTLVSRPTTPTAISRTGSAHPRTSRPAVPASPQITAAPTKNSPNTSDTTSMS